MEVGGWWRLGLWLVGSGRMFLEPALLGENRCLNGPAVSQLRREARLRREYLYRKAREEAERTAQERKDKVRRALEGTCVPRSPISSRDLSFKTQRNRPQCCKTRLISIYLR